MGASDRHLYAARLIESGDEEQAFAVLNDLLRDERDDAEALFMLGNVYAKAEQFTPAWLCFRRAAELRPNQHQVLNNVGMALEGLGHGVEAREHFMRAHKIHPTHANYPSNVGMTYLLEADHARAIQWAEKALALDPEHGGAHTCRGFARLAQADWAGGWDDWRYALGGKYRGIQDYGLPEWTGEAGARVIVCGEQGIGDEIQFASCIPDLLARVDAVAIDCDARLSKLFRRSFSDRVTVHGTRRGPKAWAAEGGWTHQIMTGELPRFFRRSAESFPRLAFITPSPDLREMYGALQRRHAGGKIRVGLCMHGGQQRTGLKKRAMGPEAFAALIERHGEACEFFSLDYRPDAAERIKAAGLPIHHFHWAVGLGADYDHTAGFLAALDVVVGVHTSAHHAAGAMGVPTVAFVPERPTWNYGAGLGDALPWYPSVRLFRQRHGESWAKCVRRFSDDWRPEASA